MKDISLVVHSDWSIHPKKRVLSSAHLTANGRYRISSPRLVGNIETFLDRTGNSLEENSCALIGFDFPIGLPYPYAEKAGAVRFLEILPRLGEGEWHEFYAVAETPEEITLRRPFYPHKPGGSRYEHLIHALSANHPNALRRTCDQKTSYRRAAAPLFWTVGAQQVGKAAICGWRDVLAPALRGRSPGLAIWPFSGAFEDLLMDHRVVIVESYPAEFYQHIGITFGRGQGSGKRSCTAQAKQANVLKYWALKNQVELEHDLSCQMDAGFTQAVFEDDGFDSLVGVIGMLNVILGNRPPGAPDSEIIQNTEGWIFGQSFI